MAVVQISKIQVRKGEKLKTGIPQLSGGEFAWAVDTQELFIGNGPVSEGAPAVGNTKILTEYDNILDLSRAYRFEEGNPSITSSVGRSLQSKLDDFVNVADYGAVPDVSTDSTQAFQRALNDLYVGASNNTKKKLFVPPGQYNFLTNLRVPSNAVIEGESVESVVLNFDTNSIVTSTASGTPLGLFTSVDRPENITISNLTVRRSSGQLVLTGVKKAYIYNVKFQGEYVIGSSSGSAAVSWENSLEATKADEIVFDRCQFESVPIGIYALSTTSLETGVTIKNCKFYVNYNGIYIAGLANQVYRWKIENCLFDTITDSGLYSTNGVGTKILNSTFRLVGNGGTGGPTNPQFPMVYFAQSVNNQVIDCWFDRAQAYTIVNSNLTRSIPEVLGAGEVKIGNQIQSNIVRSDSFRPMAVFSSLNRKINLNYVLKLGSFVRQGQLSIAIQSDLVAASISDHYQYTTTQANFTGAIVGGTLTVTDITNGSISVNDVIVGEGVQGGTRIAAILTGAGGVGTYSVDISQTVPSTLMRTAGTGAATMTNFDFGYEIRNNDQSGSAETLVLTYRNPLATGATGTIDFFVSYGV